MLQPPKKGKLHPLYRQDTIKKEHTYFQDLKRNLQLLKQEARSGIAQQMKALMKKKSDVESPRRVEFVAPYRR